MGKSSKPHIFVNEVLLQRGHAHLLTSIDGCFCVTMTESNTCQRDNVADKAQSVYYLALYRKCLQIPTNW